MEGRERELRIKSENTFGSETLVNRPQFSRVDKMKVITTFFLSLPPFFFLFFYHLFHVFTSFFSYFTTFFISSYIFATFISFFASLPTFLTSTPHFFSIPYSFFIAVMFEKQKLNNFTRPANEYIRRRRNTLIKSYLKDYQIFAV